jgi:myosin VIIa
LQERLLRIDQEVADEEQRQREEALYKLQRIDIAEQRRHAPVNDSEMVDEMFGFMDTSNDLGEGMGPNAFQVLPIA